MSEKRDRFIEAYYQYYTVVFNAVYLKVNNIDDAEDICQEVFIRFYHKIDEVRNIKQWLYGALKLVVLEYYKKRRNDQVNIDEVFNDIGLTFVNGLKESRIIISEAMEHVDSELTDEERTVFELIAFYNYSYKETARHTGLTMRKVEYRYSRIVEKILDYLKKKGIKNLDGLL